MLQMFCGSKLPDLGALANVYEESISNAHKQFNTSVSDSVRYLDALQDFYDFIRFFLREYDGMIAVWTAQGAYVAALRVELYQDGFLLTGLETRRTERRRGYATQLVTNVADYLKGKGHQKIYSHVDKHNAASLSVHKECGFETTMDYAVFVDGSVSHNSYTLCKNL